MEEHTSCKQTRYEHGKRRGRAGTELDACKREGIDASTHGNSTR